MQAQNFTLSIERKLERVMETICQVEDICGFSFKKTVDSDNLLQYEVILERIHDPSIEMIFPVMTVAMQSSQWLTHQLLNACGWKKSEVSK